MSFQITKTEKTILIRALVFGIVVMGIIRPIWDTLSNKFSNIQIVIGSLILIGVWFYITDTKDGAYRTRFFR